MSDLEYVKRKLDDKLFNTSAVAKQNGISRSTLLNIKNGVQVKSYVIKVLADFFRKAGD